MRASKRAHSSRIRRFSAKPPRVIGATARKAVGAANKQRLRQNYLADDMVAAHKKLMLETAGK